MLFYVFIFRSEVRPWLGIKPYRESNFIPLGYASPAFSLHIRSVTRIVFANKNNPLAGLFSFDSHSLVNRPDPKSAVFRCPALHSDACLRGSDTVFLHGRRVRQRRDATGAPIQVPECRAATAALSTHAFWPEITALTILAEAGDMRRFSHHRQFLKYCGLDLAKSQSGQSRGKETLSKRGNKRLRMIFGLAGVRAVHLRENEFRAKYQRYLSSSPSMPIGSEKHSPQSPQRWRVLLMASSRTERNISHFMNNNFPVDRSRSYGPLRRLRPRR